MRKLFTIYIFLSMSISLFAQGDRFSYLLDNELKNYTTPFITTFGTVMNTSGYHSAEIPDLFGFSISFVGMYIFIPDDQRTFSAGTPAGYETGNTATIYGDKGGAFIGPDGTIVYPPGVDQTAIPAALPQLAASFMGTEVMLRFIPSVSIGDGSLSFFGFGLRHSISRYIPKVPVDIAVQFLYNNFNIENLDQTNIENYFTFNSSNFAFNVHASKKFGLFTAYGGLQYESSGVDIEYTYVDRNGQNPLLNNTRVTLEIDGDNSFRTTIGGAVKLAFFVVNIDYSLASQSLLTGGISFEF